MISHSTCNINNINVGGNIEKEKITWEKEGNLHKKCKPLLITCNKFLQRQYIHIYTRWNNTTLHEPLQLLEPNVTAPAPNNNCFPNHINY